MRVRDVAWVRYVLEASEGLAVLIAERGGKLVLAAPPERGAELDRLVADLEAELEVAGGALGARDGLLEGAPGSTVKGSA